MEEHEAQRLSKSSFMKILPMAANRCIIFGRNNDNYIDVGTDCASTDQIFITTKTGHYTVDDEGNVRKDY